MKVRAADTRVQYTTQHNIRSQFLADGSEESLKGLDGALLAQPEQPGDAEVDPGRLLPGAGVPSEPETACTLSQGVFAVAPRNLLHQHGITAVAVHAAHGVEEEDQESPQEDELKAPLTELVVTGRRLMAARADRRRNHGGGRSCPGW